MDSGGVRRRDTTKGPPLRILSLDGGGVRGYSMLIIIQELMHRTFVELEGHAPKRGQIPKPADYFDLIVGTGTGGLIALMLGRLRLDLETCKELYVRLTRLVFETDKTIAGIPYRSTLFKASKLEEAIREAVREHTIFTSEGNDGAEPDMMSPISAAAFSSAGSAPRRHSSNASVVSFSARSPQAQMARPYIHPKYGNPTARLYDRRENRTKTAITAVYQGTPKGGAPALLRSYDSRKESAPEVDCTIWEAGRATCAIGLAFKPIRIGQSIFHDNGGGTFNPAPEALDEATVNEWPGREVGVFFSVGTGRRPKGSDANQSMWYEDLLGEFAEARRRLIAKIEGCEAIHESMIKERLARRGVNVENYYRFNVEIGVGEFGMNEWHRLGEISTNTRRYLARDMEQRMLQGAAAKIAKIQFAQERYEHAWAAQHAPQAADDPQMGRPLPPLPPPPPAAMTPPMPFAIELPAEVPPAWPRYESNMGRASYDAGADTLALRPSGNSPSPRASTDRVSASNNPHSRPVPMSNNAGASPRVDHEDRFVVTAPTPSEYRYASGTDKIAIISADERPNASLKGAASQPHRIEPPPLPPKTPLPENMAGKFHQSVAGLPYPLDDEAPPPPIDMARKPEFRGR